MADLALKLPFQEPISDRKFYFEGLLSKALMESLCPLFDSEIVIGNLEPVLENQVVPFWIEALVRGDLEGKIGLAGDESSLKRLAKKNYQTDQVSPLLFRTLLLKVHDEIIKRVEKQFEDEAFRCDLKKGSGFQEKYVIEAEPGLFCCSVSLPDGVVRVFISLFPTSKEIQQEIENQKADDSKKIRVFSSQIDWLVEQVRKAEDLEKRLLQGPETRAQLRGQLKQMKRVLHQLRTDSLDTLIHSAERLIAQVAKPLGKKVELKMTGSWVSVHKTLLNSIYEPVLLLIRNSVEHGIETPLNRERVGKKEAGNVSILSSFKNGTIRLIVSDDGKGLDFGLIREKAIAKGIYSQEEINLKSNEELAELVFEAGFSTVGGFSSKGERGVGLDVVRKSIENMGGKIQIVSTSEHGTSFELLIPVSDELSPLSEKERKRHLQKEEEEKLSLIDEVSDYLERFSLAIHAMNEQESSASAYEAYRISHLMKGLCGVLGWNRVVSFLNPIEEVLKSISEEKILWNEGVGQLFREIEFQLKSFIRASIGNAPFSLFSLRKLEKNLLRLLWSLPQSEEKNHFFVGKHHLSSIESFFLPLAANGSFSVRPESQVMKCLEMPFGSLVHFTGDRKGFAGIYSEEKTLKEVIIPAISGYRGELSEKKLLTQLNEFGLLMGRQLSEQSFQMGLNLQSSTPFSFRSEGQSTRWMGTPTYCYACEINGHPFYLAGDFRLTAESMEKEDAWDLNWNTKSADDFRLFIEAWFTKQNIALHPENRETQSDLVGKEGEVSFVIPLSFADRPGIQALVFLTGEGVESIGKEPQKIFSSDLGFQTEAPLFFGGRVSIGHLPLALTPLCYSGIRNEKKFELKVVLTTSSES